MKVRIDADRCTGHGRCYSLSPELFDCDDEGNGLVRIEGELDAVQQARARLAADSCPERAIHLTD